mgnify:CR=1 FL=1
MTLAIDDAFRQKHPNVVRAIEKASADSLWQIVRAEPVVAAAHPKAKAKSKAKAKAKSKAQQEERQCFFCDKPGHLKADCEEWKAP